MQRDNIEWSPETGVSYKRLSDIRDSELRSYTQGCVVDRATCPADLLVELDKIPHVHFRSQYDLLQLIRRDFSPTGVPPEELATALRTTDTTSHPPPPNRRGLQPVQHESPVWKGRGREGAIQKPRSPPLAKRRSPVASRRRSSDGSHYSRRRRDDRSPIPRASPPDDDVFAVRNKRRTHPRSRTPSPERRSTKGEISRSRSPQSRRELSSNQKSRSRSRSPVSLRGRALPPFGVEANQAFRSHRKYNVQHTQSMDQPAQYPTTQISHGDKHYHPHRGQPMGEDNSQYNRRPHDIGAHPNQNYPSPQYRSEQSLPPPNDARFQRHSSPNPQSNISYTQQERFQLPSSSSPVRVSAPNNQSIEYSSAIPAQMKPGILSTPSQGKGHHPVMSHEQTLQHASDQQHSMYFVQQLRPHGRMPPHQRMQISPPYPQQHPAISHDAAHI